MIKWQRWINTRRIIPNIIALLFRSNFKCNVDRPGPGRRSIGWRPRSFCHRVLYNNIMTTIITAGDRHGGPRDYPVGRRWRPEGKRRIARRRRRRSVWEISARPCASGPAAGELPRRNHPPGDRRRTFSLFSFLFFPPFFTPPPTHPLHSETLRNYRTGASANMVAVFVLRRPARTAEDRPKSTAGYTFSSANWKIPPGAGEAHTCFFFEIDVTHHKTFPNDGRILYRRIPEYLGSTIGPSPLPPPRSRHPGIFAYVVLTIRETHESRFVVLHRRL